MTGCVRLRIAIDR